MDISIMEMLAQHEETISDLYSAYSKQFPEHREFWATLAWEENDHARQIRELEIEVKNRHAAFDNTAIKVIVIKKSLEYVKNQTVEAQKKGILLARALSVALDIEKSVIDGEFFDAFKGFTAKSRKLIRELGNEVQEHYKIIEAKWNEHRRYA